jgi:YesN/AraC family two-component response regulator
MKSNIVNIKNMVCPRCIETVGGIFHDLNIEISKIQLGEVSISKSINAEKEILLKDRLLEKGFELLEDNKSRLIGNIKSIIIDQIHYSKEPIHVNFSFLLSEKLEHDYSYLSRLFSMVEGKTIEKFILAQKIERAKELIFYNELTVSEIAFQMNYSSAAHLSSQFKRETGMTPTEFKKLKRPGHQALDSF